ncbi:MAG: HAD-IB family hydrolase [Candidatus Limiplasma sp.]|nr:HAD-IB family hydrolase [Candidatus Limiplasma sp.]MEA5146449.1 HAD-IB family hydrolase [Candidatus Limiplasma sp.]
MQTTYALFDFDGTLIRGDSIILLCQYAYRHRLISLRELLAILGAGIRYGLRLASAVQAKERALRFLIGKTAAEMDAFVADFYREALLPRLRPEAEAAIRAHQAQGHTVLLVSASAAFYLEPLRARLGLADIIATRIAVEGDGVFTGRVCGDNCRGVQKALRLAEYLAAKGARLAYDTSTAYGDSTGDLAMLRLCAHKVAVNPKRKLWRALRHEPGATRVCWREP